MTIHAVVWTNAHGGRSEFHYACPAVAEGIAKALAKGWRKDAHVERLEDDRY